MREIIIPNDRGDKLSQHLQALYSCFKGVNANEQVRFNLRQLTWVSPLVILPICAYAYNTKSQIEYGGPIKDYMDCIGFPKGVDTITAFEQQVQRFKNYGRECGIPIVASTYQALEKYLAISRPRLLKPAKTKIDELFVTEKGEAFKPGTINEIFQKYRGDKHIHPHSMRHACALHMIKNGAGLRDVQVLLGHRSLKSTVTYTVLTANDLKDLQARFHSRERKRFSDEKAREIALCSKQNYLYISCRLWYSYACQPEEL